jgi:hypothetical protein
MSPVALRYNRPEKRIAFRFAPAKARAAILWMLEQRPSLDLHTILKTCYFADKAHLNEHGRPIFGACYRAMKFGPVPVEIYEMTKGEPLWLSELDASAYPWMLEGHRLRRLSNESIDLSDLSESDLDALRVAFKKCVNMTFNERTAITHGPDWQAAELGWMKYEDMIEDSPTKEETVAFLRETGRFLKL